MIKLRTLGESIIEIDGERFAPDSDALFAALVYLSAERGRQLSRTSLADLLWPHLTPDRGRHCLRQLLYRIRSLGAAVDGVRENLVLPESLVAPTFSAQPTAERLVAERMAGARVIGPYLPGYAPRDRPLFAEWLDRTRAAVEARVRRVVLEVVHAHKLRSEWDQVDALARDCLRLDPLNEEATLAVAEATAMNGGKHDALAIIDKYVEEIGSTHAELRIQPMVLRRRIAERMPSRRYFAPADRCFVGRSALMEVLTTSVQRARAGDGSAALLVGAPGIGKTRLLQELTGHAAMQGVRVVRVGIEEVDLERPMAAFVDAVPQLRALPGAIGASPESLAFLERLTEAPSDTIIPVADAADPRWIASRIRKAVVDLVDAVSAEATVMLVIEDVHWLDAASWATISALLDIVPTRRLWLALTSRGPYPAPGIPDRCVERLFVHGVPAIDDQAALTLVRAIAADHRGAIAEEALRWCVTVGEGNPLFLRELVVHCLEGGRTHAIPPSLQGLLDVRISRLQPTAKRVLQAAAVLGDHATIDRVGAMLDLHAHHMIGAIEELTTAGLTDGSMLLVQARHVLLRSRAVETMPTAILAWLHKRAAVALSGADPTNSDRDLLLACALHWRQSGESYRALTVLLESATANERIGAVVDAIPFIEAALRIENATVGRSALLRRLARYAALIGDWHRVRAAGLELATLSHDESDQDAAAADQLLALHASMQLDVDPETISSTAYEIASDRRLSAPVRVEAAKQGLIIAANSGSSARQPDYWHLIRPIEGDSTKVAADVILLGMMYETSLGEPTQALRYADELTGLADEEPDVWRRLTWRLGIAEAYRMLEAIELEGRSNHALLQEARRLGSTHFEVRAAERIAESHIDGGRVAEALHWLSVAEAAGGRADVGWRHMASIVYRARIALLLGDLYEAHALALQHHQEIISNRFPLMFHRRTSATLLVEIQLHLFSSQVDALLLSELEETHTEMQSRRLHDRTMAALAVAMDRVGKGDRAQALVEEYVERHRRSLRPWTDPLALLRLS